MLAARSSLPKLLGDTLAVRPWPRRGPGQGPSAELRPGRWAEPPPRAHGRGTGLFSYWYGILVSYG